MRPWRRGRGSGNATSGRSSGPVPQIPPSGTRGAKTLVDLGAVATIPAID